MNADPALPDVGFDAPDVPGHDDREPTAIRATAVMIAFMTLVASFLTYLVADAAMEASSSAGTARRLATDGQGKTADLNGAGLANVETVLREAIAESDLSVLRGADLSYPEYRATWREEASVAQDALRQAADRATIRPGDPRHVDRDEEFPNRLLVDYVDRSAALYLARQHAATERASSWQEKRSTYLGALVIVAVALYLLGFSLTLERRQRTVFLAAGVLLSTVGIALATRALATSVSGQADRAAGSFADGVYETLTALEPAGFDRAVGYLSEAIEERPTFAGSYRWRGDAIWRRAITRLDIPRDVYASIVPLGDRLQAIRDYRAALERGDDDARLLADLGFDEVMAGLDGEDGSLVDAGAKHLRRAAALYRERLDGEKGLDDAALAAFNEAFSYAAAAREEAAGEAYAQAVDLASDLDQAARDDVLTGALTDLDYIGDTELKEVVVGREAPSGGTTSISGGEATVDTDVVRVDRLRFSDVESESRIAEVWYRKVNGSWQGLAYLSSTALTPDDFSGSRLRSHEVSYFGACNAPGEYKVELYLDGRLQRVLFARNGGKSKEAAIPRLSLGLCAPADWRRHVVIPGAVEGFVAEDGKSGAFFFRLPALPGESGGDQARRAVARALGSLPLPATAVSYLEDYEPDFIQWFLYGEYARRYARTAGSFWTYPGGSVRTEAGVPRNGTEVIGGIVYGPGEYALSGEAHSTLTSAQPST